MCERVFSVGFGPGLDSMSPARIRRSACHAAETHGWLPAKKNGVAGPLERRDNNNICLKSNIQTSSVHHRCVQFAQPPPQL